MNCRFRIARLEQITTTRNLLGELLRFDRTRDHAGDEASELPLRHRAERWDGMCRAPRQCSGLYVIAQRAVMTPELELPDLVADALPHASIVARAVFLYGHGE